MEKDNLNKRLNPREPKKVSSVQDEIQAMKAKRASQVAATPKTIKEHTVADGETLSHIALKYYGSAVKDKWMKIYEANKSVIGDNPNIIRPGQVLKIPEL